MQYRPVEVHERKRAFAIAKSTGGVYDGGMGASMIRIERA